MDGLRKGDSFKRSSKEHPKYVSAPNVSQELNTTDVTIEGQFTVQEAKDLASILNAGALPVKLTEKYSTSVGAQFGQQALHDTVFAGIVGIAIIFLFMLFYYRLPGLIAVITLSVYIYITLQIFDWMNAVLTLPGIAALILGVGMAVDANIITYERIKEELKLGKSVRSAFRSGNRRSFATIFDANITTIIAAVVLFIFGTSSVKGFATMLILSILTSFITAVFLSRFLLALLVESRWLDRKKAGSASTRSISWIFRIRTKVQSRIHRSKMGFHEQTQIFLYFLQCGHDSRDYYPACVQAESWH